MQLLPNYMASHSIKEQKMGEACKCGEEQTHTGFWWDALKETDILGKSGPDWRITFKWILKKQDRMAWTGFIWLRIGATDELFRTR